jgi:hypothetical protein
MSLSLTLASDVAIREDPGNTASDFLVSFFPPIELGSLAWQVALLQFDGWFTTFNITSGNAVLVWSLDNNVTPISIPVPDGNYAVQDLNDLLAQSMRNNGGTGTDPITGRVTYGVTILPNFNTNRVVIVIDNTVGVGNTFTFDLSVVGNLSTLLGFNPSVITTTTNGPFEPRFNAGVDQWQVRCDLIRNSYSNGIEADILFNFVPQVPPSAHVTIQPLHLSYLQVNKSQINSVRIRLTDQNGNLLNFNGQNVVVTLKLKAIGAPE